MTESELQREIEKLCDKLGLLWWHDNYSLRNKPGLPDLIIVGHAVLWAELKSNTGSMKPAQRMWRNDLNSAGQEYRLWYPSRPPLRRDRQDPGVAGYRARPASSLRLRRHR